MADGETAHIFVFSSTVAGFSFLEPCEFLPPSLSLFCNTLAAIR